MKKITIPQEIRFQISEKFLCAFFFFFFFFIFVMWKLCMKSFHRLSMCVSIYGYGIMTLKVRARHDIPQQLTHFQTNGFGAWKIH